VTNLDPPVAAAGNPAEPEAAKPLSAGRGRSVAAVACLVLAALLTVPAVSAYWAQRTLNDTQRYLATVGPLVHSPQVQAAIVTKVTDAIEKQVDVEAILNNVFAGVITDRPRLQQLVGPISSAVDGVIESQVRDFVASDTFGDLWIAANTRAQQRLVQLLKGEESGAISIQGDQVVLDVSEVIDQVKQRLVARGLTIAANIPTASLDREIVLLDASQLSKARNIYAFTNPVAKWLIVLVAVLYLAAFMLARRRPRMATTVGLVIAANAALLGLFLSVGRQLFVNGLSGSILGPAGSVLFATLLGYLERAWHVLFWLGLIIALAGLLAGPNAPGTAVRHTVRRGLESIGAELPSSAVGAVGAWVRTNARWLRPVAGILGVVVLLWGNDVSLSRLFWSTVTVIVLLALVQVLAGADPDNAGADPVNFARA
jgi:hypothetical protein